MTRSRTFLTFTIALLIATWTPAWACCTLSVMAGPFDSGAASDHLQPAPQTSCCASKRTNENDGDSHCPQRDQTTDHCMCGAFRSDDTRAQPVTITAANVQTPATDFVHPLPQWLTVQFDGVAYTVQSAPPAPSKSLLSLHCLMTT